MRRLVLATAVAGVAVAWALSSRMASEAEPRTRSAPLVSATRVVRGSLSRSIVLSAEFQPYQEIAVHSKVAGFVRSINVDVGDRVRTGDTIAMLEIPEANDDLHKATAATLGATEDVRHAQARYDEVHLGSDRLLEVARKRPDLVAQQDIDAATAQDREAEAALGSAKQRLAESVASESRMRTMLSYAVITAPFDGVVTKRFADTGALVQSGTASNTQAMPVVSLAQNRLLRLEFPVPESAVSYVSVGAPVDVEVPSLKSSFKGTVTRFARQVDRATRTMQTEVDVPNGDLRLTPGMYAAVTLILEEHNDVLCAPVQAVRGEAALAVGPGGRLEKRVVRTGLETPERVEILEGLQEGDLVVVGGQAGLRPGDPVTPSIAAAPSSGGKP